MTSNTLSWASPLDIYGSELLLTVLRMRKSDKTRYIFDLISITVGQVMSLTFGKNTRLSKTFPINPVKRDLMLFQLESKHKEPGVSVLL